VKKLFAGDRQSIMNMRSWHHEQRAFAVPDLPQSDTTVPPTPSRDGVPRVPNRYQIELRPVDLDATLAPKHPARAVWAFVEGLDLSALYRDIGSVEGRAGRAASRCLLQRAA